MKILILEKCIDVQHSLQSFFEALGHDTMVADSPVTALSLSRTFDLDILISEYFSDDENYLKLFELIKSNKSHAKIIILTATNYTLDALQPLFDMDVKNIFQKPINPKIICYAIDEFAKHKSVSSFN
jgi:DNA-binding response OmpR family regulator